MQVWKQQAFILILISATARFAAATRGSMGASLRRSPRQASTVGPSVLPSPRRHVMCAFTPVLPLRKRRDFVPVVAAILKPALGHLIGTCEAISSPAHCV